MSCVWITSDWHLGHKKQCRWREGFSDYQAVAEHLFDEYQRKVTKRDVIWFLGDMLLSNEYMERFAELPGDKRLIIGNHCTERVKFEDMVKCFNKVYGLVNYKRAWLSHAPIHPDELRGKVNIHGHTHYHCIPDERYFNVCPEVNNWEIVKYQDIVRIGQ